MFDALLAWLSDLWTTFEDVLQSAWNFCWKVSGWLIAAYLAVFAFVQWIVQEAGTLLGDLLSAMGAITPSTADVSGVGSGNWLTIANTFFPVDVGFSLLIALSALWIACTTYRLIKSWIPTLS